MTPFEVLTVVIGYDAAVLAKRIAAGEKRSDAARALGATYGQVSYQYRRLVALADQLGIAGGSQAKVKRLVERCEVVAKDVERLTIGHYTDESERERERRLASRIWFGWSLGAAAVEGGDFVETAQRFKTISKRARHYGLPPLIEQLPRSR